MFVVAMIKFLARKSIGVIYDDGRYSSSTTFIHHSLKFRSIGCCSRLTFIYESANDFILIILTQSDCKKDWPATRSGILYNDIRKPCAVILGLQG